MRRVKLIAFQTCLILQRHRQEFRVGGTKLDFDSRVELPMIIGENGKSNFHCSGSNIFKNVPLPSVFSILIHYDPDPRTLQYRKF